MKAGSPRSAGLDRPAGPARPAAVPLVGGACLPLAFILLGLAALAVAAGWLLRQPALTTLPYLHPHTVALVHLWLPGFLLSVCIGAVYQLMPVVLGVPLVTRVSVLWIHFSLHAAGTVLLAGAFATGRFAWAGLGGSLVAAGAGVLFTAVVKTFASAGRRDAAAWCFPLAAGWLVATAGAGVALAVNSRWPWLPLSAVDLLRAHAHLGLAGFFLTLLQGTTFQLIPMFTMGELRRPRLVWAGLLATQAGLPALAAGLAWDQALLTRAGAVIVAGGVVASALALHATLRARRRKKVEPGIKAFVLGATVLGLSALAGAWLAFAPAGHPLVPRGVSVYGILLIPGALSLAVLGMLCKIVPFLVWMRAYGPKVGKQPVPVATALASRPLENGWLAFHVAGVGLLAAGCGLAGGVALAVATALFLTNMLRVLAHLGSRRQPAAFGPGPASLTSI